MVWCYCYWYYQPLTHGQSVTVCKYAYIITFEHKNTPNSALNPMMAPHYRSCLTLTHLDMCFGLVEQSQCGVPTAVWSQRDEGLQPLQTQAEMCSSMGGDTVKKGNFSSQKQHME